MEKEDGVYGGRFVYLIAVSLGGIPPVFHRGTNDQRTNERMLGQRIK